METEVQGMRKDELMGKLEETLLEAKRWQDRQIALMKKQINMQKKVLKLLREKKKRTEHVQEKDGDEGLKKEESTDEESSADEEDKTDDEEHSSDEEGSTDDEDNTDEEMSIDEEDSIEEEEDSSGEELEEEDNEVPQVNSCSSLVVKHLMKEMEAVVKERKEVKEKEKALKKILVGLKRDLKEIEVDENDSKKRKERGV